MRNRVSLVTLGLVVALFALPIADPAASQSPAPEPSGSRLTIIPTGIERPDFIKVNTGRKAQMKDGEVSTVYETWKPKQGNTYVEIVADLSVDPGPLFVETPMIRLEGGDPGTGGGHVPVYWYLDTGLEPARTDSVTIHDQARLDMTFEVPATALDSLTLWIGGLRVASLQEIRERVRREEGVE